MIREKIYLIASLRSKTVRAFANELREYGFDVFDDWHAAGPEADDIWRDYHKQRGHTFLEALQHPFSKHVFAFDEKHLSESEVAILMMPAGKSGCLELGIHLGKRKRGYILLDPKERKLPEDWHWLTGLYEGEGCLTHNKGPRNSRGLALTVTMRDLDVVRRLHKVSGVGHINGPYPGKKDNHSAMWRWAVNKREDVLFVANGMYEHLSARRREQIIKSLAVAGISEAELLCVDGPATSRWDQMFRFATGIFDDKAKLIAELQRPGTMRTTKPEPKREWSGIV